MTKELREFFKKQGGVKLAYLFGSSTKEGKGKLSDVDIAVLVGAHLSRKERFKLELELISKLTSLLKTNSVDLVVMNDAPISLNYEVIKANHPVFVMDRGEKIDFEHGVLSRYLDRRYYEKRAAAEFLKKVAEEGI